MKKTLFVAAAAAPAVFSLNLNSAGMTNIEPSRFEVAMTQSARHANSCLAQFAMQADVDAANVNEDVGANVDAEVGADVEADVGAEMFEEDKWRNRESLIYSNDNLMDAETFYELAGNFDESYEDEDFAHDSSALYWTEQGESKGDIAKREQKLNIVWESARKTLPNAELFTDGKEVDRVATISDVKQGAIGNCWLKAAIASLAENPEAV